LVQALELRRAADARLQHRRELAERGRRRRVQDQVPLHARDDLARRAHADEPWLARKHAPDRLAVCVLPVHAARLKARSEASSSEPVKPRPMKTMRERRSSSGQASRCSGGWTTCWTPFSSSGPPAPTFSRPFTRRTSAPRAARSIVSHTPKAVQSSCSSKTS